MNRTHKNLIRILGFSPKENTSNIFFKKYANEYTIELDFDKKLIDYGKKIKTESKTTQNFSQSENWVVLECVNRLLGKGYKPKNITLEKTYPSGHGHSGRLDICVSRNDGSEYLLIECKTWGKEFDNEFARMKKDGGQLFTYFKFSNKADIVMLYSSELNKREIVYRNEIVKIEDDYRSGDVKDFYDKWNKLTKNNGIFNSPPYNFVSKAITPKLLESIKQEDSGFIFNRFLEILRHNVVSDKPNAFNKIFTLFLCKIYDEKSTVKNEELKFQWLEGIDDDVSFQMRLADLYQKGMYEFLEKKVTDFSTSYFETKYKSLDEKVKKDLLKDITKLRLEKNNEFAIKEVFDNKSFKENAKVVKQVVELLQKFKIRYTKKQQYLSDFFELLLTTGLKQESGQFFTPVPIAQFIIKSIPIDELIDEKLQKGEQNNLLPYVIDYAAGSGHFLTEVMHEIQRNLNKKDTLKYIPDTAKKIKNWQQDHFDWALQYVYGIEKDYRLVKVGKVGCYLHGDGLAHIIHSDGLGNFKKTEEYKDQLAIIDTDFPKENKQFDMVVSNPPYSVQAFKQNARNYYTEKDFELYEKLTDNSSEIECLFVERTKQLLKDGGMAGIILPSSILSNTGIYTKTREIILQHFDIVAIAELGSNTFMATGTNTVTLFLRRKNNYESINLKESVKKFFTNLQDVTLNSIENPVAKYVAYNWEGISFDDYKTLLQKQPNEATQQHEIYQEYHKKIKAENEQEKWNEILKLEEEKLFYFIIAYPQKVVLVKSGQKKEEKQFLGYEFSNRRGNEGIHPIQRGKNIDECTSLFDADIFDNPKKASAYIYKAFKGDFDFPIHESLQKNISRADLVDMLSFDRVDFEKNISLSAKKKVRIESKWDLIQFNNAIIEIRGNSTRIPKTDILEVGKYPVITQQNGVQISGYSNEIKTITDFPLVLFGDHSCTFKYIDFEFFRGADGTVLLKPNNNFDTKYFFCFLQYLGINLIENRNKYERHFKYLQNIKIPLPPKDIQEKIVVGIEVLEQKRKNAINKIEQLKETIFTSLKIGSIQGNISDLCEIANEKLNPTDFPNKKFCYLGLEHIESNSGKISYRNFENGSKIQSAKNIFKSGNILYGKLRPYLNKVVLVDFEGICSTDILVLKSKAALILKYILLSNEFVKKTSALMKGVSLPRIKIDTFLNLKILIPHSSQHKIIISEIEKIETQITELEKEIRAIPQQKEKILKKYL